MVTQEQIAALQAAMSRAGLPMLQTAQVSALMGWTQEQVDSFKESMFKVGMLQSMSFADQEYVFRSFEDAMKWLGQAQAGVNAATGKGYRLAAHRKGA